jgi:hypothetical protein
VARRAVDVEALLSARQLVAADRERNFVDGLAGDLAGVERFVVAQPAARDRAGRRRRDARLSANVELASNAS